MLIGAVGPTYGADDNKADREAKRAQALQQRLEEERSQWQTEKTALQKTASDAGAALDAAKAENDKSKSALDHAAHERADLQSQVEQLKKQLADQKAASDQQQSTAQSDMERFTAARAHERLELNGKITGDEKSLAECTDHNQRLVKLGHELLVRLHNKGFLDIARQEEPFLGMGDVEMFNLVQDYRDKIDAEHFTANPHASAGTP